MTTAKLPTTVGGACAGLCATRRCCCHLPARRSNSTTPSELWRAARELGDPALVARALTACGGLAQHDRELAGPYFAEAAGLARDIGDSWLLGQILALDAPFGSHRRRTGHCSGCGGGRTSDCRQHRRRLRLPPVPLSAVLGRKSSAATCRGLPFGWVKWLRRRRGPRRDVLDVRIGDARRSRWPTREMRHGARAAAEAAHQSASELFEYYEGTVLSVLGFVHLAAGDASAAREAWEAARQRTGMDPQIAPPTTGQRWPRWRAAISQRPVAGPTTSCRRRRAAIYRSRWRRAHAWRSRKANSTLPNAMPTKRSTWRPDSAVTSSFRLRSTASPLRRATRQPLVSGATVRRRGRSPPAHGHSALQGTPSRR